MLPRKDTWMRIKYGHPPHWVSVLCSASLNNSQYRKDNLEGDGERNISELPHRTTKVWDRVNFVFTVQHFHWLAVTSHSLQHQPLPSWRPLTPCGSPARRKARERINSQTKAGHVARHARVIFPEIFYPESQ